MILGYRLQAISLPHGILAEIIDTPYSSTYEAAVVLASGMAINFFQSYNSAIRLRHAHAYAQGQKS
jgi:hypothetical protein